MTSMSRDGRRAAWGLAAMVAVVACALAFWATRSPAPLTLAREAYERGRMGARRRGHPGRIEGRIRPDHRPRSPAHLRPGPGPAGARLRRDRHLRRPAVLRGIEPEDAFLKGLAMVRTGRPESAIELWDGFLKRGVDHPEMLDHFSRLSARLQRFDPALDAARRLSRQPGWEARGLFLAGAGRGLRRRSARRRGRARAGPGARAGSPGCAARRGPLPQAPRAEPAPAGPRRPRPRRT